MDFIRSHKLCSIYLFLVLIILFIAVFASYLTPYDPLAMDFTMVNKAPSDTHIMGTDTLGRDIFSRVIMGTQASVLSAFALIIVSCSFGMSLGIYSGYHGGKRDTVIMRITDAMLSFPDLILALAIIGIIGIGLLPAMVAIALVSWSKYARLARSLTMKVRSSEYLIAAKTNGTPDRKILFGHILPNVVPVVIVNSMLDVGGMILTLASLSFLGFGIQPPTPEWGYMLSEGRTYFLTSPWLLIYPGMALLIVVIIFNLFGDSLRDALDSRTVD